jgi:hypothetical protein
VKGTARKNHIKSAVYTWFGYLILITSGSYFCISVETVKDSKFEHLVDGKG